MRIFQAALRETPLRAEILRQNAAKETEHTLGVGYGSWLILYFIIF
jgi:hypothetical protein